MMEVPNTANEIFFKKIGYIKILYLTIKLNTETEEHVK